VLPSSSASLPRIEQLSVCRVMHPSMHSHQHTSQSRLLRHISSKPRQTRNRSTAACTATSSVPHASAPAARQPTPELLPVLDDPWEDAKWTRYKWTVYRGIAYDLTSFMERHPAGSWLLNLALGRDCTALFESYHLRPDVAIARLKQLPTLDGFPVQAVPQSPRPNDSELYVAIRERVRREVFQGQVLLVLFVDGDSSSRHLQSLKTLKFQGYYFLSKFLNC
jgi:acyl-lipid (7-3)-desaturase (Delta-4 desaturase)